MALRGRTPEADDRLRLLLSSEAGLGKTWAALQMPNPYFIDTEGGTRHYADMVAKNHGAVFETTNIKEIEQEVRALMSEEHEYRTLVLDAITPVWDDLCDRYGRDPKVGVAFSANEKRAAMDMKRLLALLDSVDMHVVVTSHEKSKWKDGQAIGTTAAAMKGLDHRFDLYLQLEKVGTKRLANVTKTRFAKEFPDGDRFEFSYAELERRFGADRLQRKAKVIEFATESEVARLEHLVASLGLSESDTVQKWLKAARVTSLADMPRDAVNKCIEWCSNRQEAS